MGINDGWQADVQREFAIDIYKHFWDGCEVIENDTLGKTESVAQLLDFGDVDKIIKIGGKQIHMAQRFRKPYWSEKREEWVDPDFTLRYSRPTSDNVIEYERLMNAYEDGASAYPKRYSFARVHNDHTKGIMELYIINTDSLIEAIKSGRIREDGPIRTNEGQEFMAYSPAELQKKDIVEKYYPKDKPKGGSKITDYM